MGLSTELANITWMLIAAALVMLMQAGFCCLESGLARAKNSINVAIKNLSDFCVAGVLFWVCGFGLMFGKDAWGLVGTDSFLLSGKESAWLLAFFLFQLVFCGTSTTIVSGAVAERMSFSGYLLISAMISAVIYPVFGHWAWGGVVEGTGKGWLAELGFIDFAGSTVVHSVGGWVSLASVLFIGPRLGRFQEGFSAIHGNNYPLATLGTMLLWFGWFGFNGGSTLAIDSSIPLILVNTNLAAAAGGLAALFLSWQIKKRSDVGDIMNGVIAGLVGITAGCHLVSPAAAVFIGASSGVLCILGMLLLERLRVDDVVGAIPVHGISGAWGTLALAFLADPARFGNGHTPWQQFQVQLLGVSVCLVWCLVTTFLMLGVLSLFVKLRVSPEAEIQGLNISEHGASTELIDLLQDMRRQCEDGDFRHSVLVEPHTEVGQIASEYNKVLHKVVEEIEQRESLVQRLRVAEEKFRAIFEHASEGIFRFAPDGRILDANPAFAEILGYADGAQLKHEVSDYRRLFAVDVAAGERLQGLLTAQGKVANYELFVQRQDGQPIEVSLNARAVNDARGRLDYIEGSLADMTDRRRSERFYQEKEAAQAANRAKSVFLATMSHEIRTPLNGVIGMLDLLTSSSLNEKQVRYAGIAKSSAHALLSLINDILDFSKIEAGKLELHIADFDLLTLLEEVADMFGHRAEQKGLELSCQVQPDVPWRVTGDSERVRQILINLVGNALKFTERGDIRMRITTRKQADGRALVRFEVEDTGVGIPTDIQSRLFQVFEQADSSTTRKYGGSGLGLAICKQLVELMGGTIGVSSQLGHGSCFSCEIPFATVEDAQPRRTGDLQIPGLKVLVVDDNETNVQILETQLTSWQAQVTSARSARAAISLLQAALSAGEPFDLLITDHQMPEMDGLELARRIHADRQLKNLPTIMLTSADCVAGEAALAGTNIRACCTKPILQSRLFDVLISTLHAQAKVALPAPEAPSAPAQVKVREEAVATREDGDAMSAIRVLIADDNEINQMVTQEIVEQAGYRCRIANNGQEAVDLLLKRHFDVVLMDCQMPVMDGFTATKEIRRLQDAGQLAYTSSGPVPIVALTANAVIGDRERCLAAGMTDYVTKPIDHRQLLAVIEKLLKPSAVVATKPHPAAAQRTGGGGLPVSRPEPLTNGELHDICAAANAVADSADVPPLDWASLLDRCGGDGKFARKVVDKFRSRIEDDVHKMHEAWEQQDLLASRRLAHALKGSSASVAAMKISETAAAIETAAKAGSLDFLPDYLNELRVRVDECLTFVDAQIPHAV